MKRSALFIILTFLSIPQCEKNRGPDPEDPVPVRDAIFLAKLIELGVDANGDGSISYAEAEKVLTLNMANAGITSLAGIEAFVQLETLNCPSNNLTRMNLSNNKELKMLRCCFNLLIKLDVSSNTSLEHLDCSVNHLSSLDLRENKQLKELLLYRMPTLYEVCVWEIPFTLSNGINLEESPNAFFTTECTN